MNIVEIAEISVFVLFNILIHFKNTNERINSALCFLIQIKNKSTCSSINHKFSITSMNLQN